ncbi:MAG: RecQ family ATP-dependent DNA helicase [Flavobacteriaceae bacterium]|nr:RecQ family ATP-dependent DNA helicase [Flavobacteriaceae bacterium]
MNAAKTLLQKYWNHQTFRAPQEDIIKAVIDEQNAIALLPTGAGKSICFQIPALVREGICIVISPLISLMEDQVLGLQKKGIKAMALTSKYNNNEAIQAFDNLRFGNYKFLYLSPEKLQSEFIQEKISQLKVNLIAVDEAHCISQWGHDFRPAYLKISILKELHPQANIIALSASATPMVMDDIINHLELKNVQIFKKSFFRNNIHIQCIDNENVFEKLKQILLNVHEPVIVYAGTRKNTIQISNYLNHQGFKSAYYHGGLSPEIKSETLQNWMDETSPVIVATNAFGMGIDKANVRAVIHMHVPSSIENYMQEIGRAGRDGKKSYAFLIYNQHTVFENENFIKRGLADTEFCKLIYGKLHENYQISYGEQPERTFTFNLQEFCNKYTLPVLNTFSALNCFENENILTVQQHVNKRSKLKIIVSHTHLMDYEERKPKLGNLIKVILRNYGGTFEQFIAINEHIIAKKINTSKFKVFDLLEQLDKDKIIIYKKANNNAEIQFLTPREDRYIINNISKNIENRNKTKITKSKAVVDFIYNDSICRNIQLLEYFGEVNPDKCNTCDVCLAQKNKKTKVDLKLVADDIMLLFMNKQQLIADDIFKQVPFEKKYIIKTLQLLIEKNSLRLTSQNKFEKV